MGKRLIFETEEEKKEHKKKLRQAAAERSKERLEKIKAEREEEHRKWEEQNRKRKLKEIDEGHSAIAALVAKLIVEYRDRRIPACRVWVEKPRYLQPEDDEQQEDVDKNAYEQLFMDLGRLNPYDQYQKEVDQAEQRRREGTLAQLEDQLTLLEAYQHPAWPEEEEAKLKLYHSVYGLHRELKRLEQASQYYHEYKCFIPQ
jgi:hypothetical protein